MLIVSRIKSYMVLIKPFFPEDEPELQVRLNYPVNLDHVTWIEHDAKVEEIDGDKPAITFHLVCSTPITWAGYETEEQRDNAIRAIERRMQFAEITY